MQRWIEKYRVQAEAFIQMGFVRDIEFSGSTYLVEVFDPDINGSLWPFLQFDDQGRLKDAFCSCPAEDGQCIHLAASYIKINGAEEIPLHERFEFSFWNQLCRIVGFHSGYEERFLKKYQRGHFGYQNHVRFEIYAKAEDSAMRMEALIENRLKETPETSIKFSNLSQDEILHWREGRPSPELRYLLSFWCDLAKWMLFDTQDAKVTFKEDSENLPTHILVDFPAFHADFYLTKKELPQLIPALDTIKTSLKVFQSVEEKVKKITFDPKQCVFHIEHTPLVYEGLDPKMAQTAPVIEKWAYVKGIGFFPKEGTSLLSHSKIETKEIPQFLEEFRSHITPFIPVHRRRFSLSYAMYFDKKWSWHFSAYLFEKGDLKYEDSVLIDNWAYLGRKGFYPLETPLFTQKEAVIPADKVSDFINHHRIWLNNQVGFQTHLASIESQLTYSITEKNHLKFQSKSQTKAHDTMDCGDWLYYAGQGFFSKQYVRLGLSVRPGLEVNASDISSFIKSNRDELEALPHFFTTTLPLEKRGLEISIHSQSSLQVKPVYTLSPDYHEKTVILYGDFVYLEGEGFCELPLPLRVPEQYQKKVIIGSSGLANFFEHELPFLKKYTLKMDPSLQLPHKCDLEVHYLARSAGKGLKAQLIYHTEMGTVPLTDLLEAADNKRRFCFTKAGLFDLHAEHFQWLRTFKNPWDVENKTVELSTLDIIRLDASLGLLGPTEETAIATISRQLLKELREFTSHEPPKLTGLTSQLRLYQQTGLQWLWFLYRNGLSGLLCDEMGLGKTHQAMALLAAVINQKADSPKRFLIVCPTSVIFHWQDKLATFLPHVNVHTFHGIKRSLRAFPDDGIILTSYGILRLEQKKLEEITFDVAIFDEIQVAKNPNSRIHEALKTTHVRMRIGLTGTPIENNLRELKALFDLVLPGYMPSEAKFREHFIYPIEKNADDEKKILLSQMIRPFVLRRRKNEVLQELPEKSEDKSFCDLSTEQAKLYRQILTQTRGTLLTELHDQRNPVNYIHVFSLLSQLKQVCNHPSLIHKDPQNYKAHTSGKWDLFVELLDEARASEQKVVVFSQYLLMLDIIAYHLQEKNWGYAQIRGDTINRREELRRFQEDPECVVFIGSLQAAGLGIDLTAASVVILYDRWWNAARENQAIDRVHRIGQKWGVQVYKLITKETVEEKIDKMITRKGRLSEEIVVSDDQAVLKKFTREELIDLLSFTE